MKFYALALSLVLFLISACQNSDPAEKAAQTVDNTVATPPQETQAPAVLDQAQLEKTASAALAAANEMEDLIKSLDALPANVKKKEAALIEATRRDLSEILEKQRNLLAEFNEARKDYTPAANKGQSSVATGQDSDSQAPYPDSGMKEYIQQLDQYAQTLPRYKDRIQKLKEGQ